MRTSVIILGFGIVVSIWACSGDQQRRSESYKSENASNSFISTSAAVESGKDSTRRFVRTADLKFKVKSVVNSTYDIENITARQGGFVTFTNLKSEIESRSSFPISADSTLEAVYYTVTNAITIRVPNIKLDTVLREISKNIVYLDHRVIKADDVSLQILSNDMTQKRSATNEKRLTSAIDSRGKRLDETTVAEDVLLGKQEQADNANLANLALKDQIKFSTSEKEGESDS